MLMAAATLAVAAVLFGLGAAAQEETPDDLPPGEGREQTFYTCSGCHGIAIVKAQGMSRERWDQTIGDMISRNNMPELDPADRAIVADYLAAAFPPRRRAPPNPFLRP
jgi:mono/diheme cytochrome c family protein